jgi:hypothetical protein
MEMSPAFDQDAHKAPGIRPYLAESPFGPETIRVMSNALEEVCQELGLRLRDDPATRLVTAKIVQFTQWGILDAETLRALTLKEFQQSSSN